MAEETEVVVIPQASDDIIAAPATDDLGSPASACASPPGDVSPEVEEDEEEKQAVRIQRSIERWEESYDEIKHFLLHGTAPDTGGTSYRNVSKAAKPFSIGPDGNLYHLSRNKDGSTSSLLVVRSYTDRLRIVKDIHVNTGDSNKHHRRDRMLEIIGERYYWKGRRRDVCECIMTCEVCVTGAAGVGRKRQRKVPGLSRDVRSPSKLMKLATSPFTVSSSILTSLSSLHQQAAQQQTANDGGKENGYLFTASPTSEALGHHSERSQQGVEVSPLARPDGWSHTHPPTSTASVTLEPQQGVKEVHPLRIESLESVETYIASEEGAGLSTPGSRDVNFLGSSLPTTIFSTIDNPTPPSSSSSSSSSHTPPPPNATPPSRPLVREASIYQSLFGLPSVGTSHTLPLVADAMHLAMRHTPDPGKLARACETSLRRTLGLAASTTIVVSPSRAAAYLTAVAASMLRVDPLSVGHPLGGSSRPSPLAVLHDACSRERVLKTCTPLMGAFNWNLGTGMLPTTRQDLASAIASNRVAAIFHQPFFLPEHCRVISLQEISQVCHTSNAASVIVDLGGMKTREAPLVGTVAKIREFFAQGADALLLPETEEIGGPPRTSLLLGRSSLLEGVARNVSLVQSQVALPLSCTPAELVGTVVAYSALSNTEP